MSCIFCFVFWGVFFYFCFFLVSLFVGFCFFYFLFLFFYLFLIYLLIYFVGWRLNRHNWPIAVELQMQKTEFIHLNCKNFLNLVFYLQLNIWLSKYHQHFYDKKKKKEKEKKKRKEKGKKRKRCKKIIQCPNGKSIIWWNSGKIVGKQYSRTCQDGKKLKSIDQLIKYPDWFSLA